MPLATHGRFVMVALTSTKTAPQEQMPADHIAVDVMKMQAIWLGNTAPTCSKGLNGWLRTKSGWRFSATMSLAKGA
jgi:hypothetical protein